MSKRKKQRSRTAGTPQWLVSGVIGTSSKADFQNWRDRGFYSGAKASEVRRIDPNTGAVIIEDILETVATAILKSDKKVTRKQASKTRKKTKRDRDYKPSFGERDAFYRSPEWKRTRLIAIKTHGRKCQCCGAKPGMFNELNEPVRIVVDHIKPIARFWHLRLNVKNLQILCDDCNRGKGSWDETDFRPRGPDEWIEVHDDIALTVLSEMNGETLQ